jgi:hypothetical protein
VTADHYLHVLQEELLPFLQGMGIGFGETFCQQGWAVFHENFDDRMLSNYFPEQFGNEWSWLPYSPGLNPCDYIL